MVWPTQNLQFDTRYPLSVIVEQGIVYGLIESGYHDFLAQKAQKNAPAFARLRLASGEIAKESRLFKIRCRQNKK